MVEKWLANSKRGRTNTDDAERSGRPNLAVVPKNIITADILKISEGSVFIILHKSLGMRKLFSKWVRRLFTSDQKQQRVEESERCLELFQRNKKGFFMRYVTMNETWIDHYTPESNRRSAEWTANSSPGWIIVLGTGCLVIHYRNVTCFRVRD